MAWSSLPTGNTGPKARVSLNVWSDQQSRTGSRYGNHGPPLLLRAYWLRCGHIDDQTAWRCQGKDSQARGALNAEGPSLVTLVARYAAAELDYEPVITFMLADAHIDHGRIGHGASSRVCACERQRGARCYWRGTGRRGRGWLVGGLANDPGGAAARPEHQHRRENDASHVSPNADRTWLDTTLGDYAPTGCGHRREEWVGS